MNKFIHFDINKAYFLKASLILLKVTSLLFPLFTSSSYWEKSFCKKKLKAFWKSFNIQRPLTYVNLKKPGLKWIQFILIIHSWSKVAPNFDFTKQNGEQFLSTNVSIFLSLTLKWKKVDMLQKIFQNFRVYRNSGLDIFKAVFIWTVKT